MFSLAGKIAVITGGGSGIGKTIAHGLSDAGARIILLGRRNEILKEALGQRAGTIYPVDLLRNDAPEEFLKFCNANQLKPNILVNAAGINPRKNAADVTPADWDAALQLNLSTPFFLAQKLVPVMRETRWGRIINIASLQSSRAFTNGITYGTTKGGIVQLTRAMAEAWSAGGINANALAPGFFPTELTTPIFSDSRIAATHASRTAIGRNGELDDLVGPALFLASDASRYITGQILYVDGGYTAK